jgi:hypothetical protein
MDDDILRLIDKLDDLIHNAKGIPLTDQVRVEREAIFSVLDEMRSKIPDQVKEARWIVHERETVLAEAREEAERIVREARERPSGSTS